MDTAQLKQLAKLLPPMLKALDVPVSHGQALDMIAALPGLRNWPEVVAFEDRIDRLPFDMPAMERLSRRLHSISLRSASLSPLAFLRPTN